MTQDTRFIISILCISLFAILTFLLFSEAAYGVEDNSRQSMSERADAALNEILNSKEFRVEEAKPPWWYELIERLFSFLPEEVGWLGTVLEWLFYAVMIIAIVVVSVILAKRFGKLPSFARNHDVPMETQSRIDDEAVKMQAYEFARAGDYRQAIRYLYLSLLLYLDKAGLLTYDMSKTDAEYVSEAHRSMGDEAPRFKSLTLFFERKWYGMEESSPGDFRQCEEMFVRLTGSD
jgi:hypothetical protein